MHYSVKFKSDGHTFKTVVSAKNIMMASRIVKTMLPAQQEDSGNAARIRFLSYR